MKILLTVALLFLSILSYSQNAVITLKNGIEEKINISASSNNELYTDIGNFKMEDIESITFDYLLDRYNELYNKLHDAGVQLFYKRETPSEEEFKSEVLNTEVYNELDDLYDKLEAFGRSHSTGTVLMATGLGVAILAGLIRDETTPKNIAIMGAVSGISFVGGVFVLAGSSRHLKDLR